MSAVQINSIREMARKADNRKGKASNASFARSLKNAHEVNQAFSKALHSCRHVHNASMDSRGKMVIRLCGGNTYPSSQERTHQIGTHDLPTMLREFDGRRASITKKDSERLGCYGKESAGDKWNRRMAQKTAQPQFILRKK